MRTLPELTPENEPFWTGGRDGRLLIMHCDACGRAIHPPQIVCPFCLSDKVTPRAAAGTGVVDARTVNRQRWAPDMTVPSALAAVALDGEDGVRITARIESDDPESVAIGDRVAVAFEEDRDIWIPFFHVVAKNSGNRTAANLDDRTDDD